ncbi:hypothetical protein U1Q18_009739 [Sarracenia purpurea var. burkii]
MVRSTGAANAQYLRGLVLEREKKSNSEETLQISGQSRWIASSHWAAAARFALAVNLTSSQTNLQLLEMGDEGNIVKKTKDAVVTLQEVLEGKHDEDIKKTLNQCQCPGDSWWTALYKVIEGTKIV